MSSSYVQSSVGNSDNLTLFGRERKFLGKRDSCWRLKPFPGGSAVLGGFLTRRGLLFRLEISGSPELGGPTQEPMNAEAAV